MNTDLFNYALQGIHITLSLFALFLTYNIALQTWQIQKDNLKHTKDLQAQEFRRVLSELLSEYVQDLRDLLIDAERQRVLSNKERVPFEEFIHTTAHKVIMNYRFTEKVMGLPPEIRRDYFAVRDHIMKDALNINKTKITDQGAYFSFAWPITTGIDLLYDFISNGGILSDEIIRYYKVDRAVDIQDLY